MLSIFFQHAYLSMTVHLLSQGICPSAAWTICFPSSPHHTPSFKIKCPLMCISLSHTHSFPFPLSLFFFLSHTLSLPPSSLSPSLSPSSSLFSLFHSFPPSFSSISLSLLLSLYFAPFPCFSLPPHTPLSPPSLFLTLCPSLPENTTTVFKKKKKKRKHHYYHASHLLASCLSQFLPPVI